MKHTHISMQILNFDKPSLPETEEDIALELEELAVGDKQLILYNDDVHTFEFVIDALIKVCKHDAIQAEQCTYLVHYKGKCSVKVGSFEELEPYCTALLDRGLSAQIE